MSARTDTRRDEDRREAREVWRGLGWTLALHLLGQALMLGIGLMWIGVSQLVYLVPCAVIFRRKRRPGVVKGLILGAALTLLLNVACAGFFLVLFARGY